SGGYLRSPKADIPWRSVSWPASTFCARDDTRAAAPRRSISRRVCSRALVIEAFAFCQFLCRACRLVALPCARDLLLFAKHLFFAALVANCLLPEEKSEFLPHEPPVRARLRPAPPMPTQCTFRSWAHRVCGRSRQCPAMRRGRWGAKPAQ